jgi:hypothetical protein
MRLHKTATLSVMMKRDVRDALYVYDTDFIGGYVAQKLDH